MSDVTDKFHAYQRPPPLPFCVNDDEGKSWSSHLCGAPHAWEHFQLALEHGIAKPTITDRDGKDITQWVASEYGDGCEACHVRRAVLTPCPECDDDVCDDCLSPEGKCKRCAPDPSTDGGSVAPTTTEGTQNGLQ